MLPMYMRLKMHRQCQQQVSMVMHYDVCVRSQSYPYTNHNPTHVVTATDPPGVYKVLTSQNHSTSDYLPAGSVYRINTGGPLPAVADTVIMVEDTRLVSTYQEDNGPLNGEEKEIETLAQVPVGENVRAPGSDVHKGDLVLQKGELIGSSGGEVGTLAFVGRKEVM